MASVRMCDRCGQIFSEKAKGWQTFQGISVDTDEFGRELNTSVQIDACPSCAIPMGSGRNVQPRLSSPDDPTPPYEKVTE